ncbi:MAG: carboxypeptidase regulatory-like domain-containing protein [Bacteroidales bacterium]|nr:carboxypeptidase regulatory-like domain-containing protein [Bacteroidales bacterium]
MNHRKKKIIRYVLEVLPALIVMSCGSSDPVDITGNISGTVYDTQDRPLQGVAMTLSPLGKTTTTGQNGMYSFEDIDADSYRVQATKSGYQEDVKSVAVKTGVTATLDFHLTPATAVLSLSQETFDFGNENTSLTLDIKNVGAAALNWQISEDISWLQCIPTSGTTVIGKSSSVILNADRTGLSKGTYSQTIAISSNGGSAVVKVNISVQGLTVKISPEELDFGSITTSITLTLTNTGSQTVSYALTPSNTWIIPSKTSGTITSGNDALNVVVDRTGLNAGDYSGALKLTVGEDNIDIPVRMNVPSKDKPTVTFYTVDSIGYVSAKFKGGIVSLGSAKVTKHGFCWSTEEHPMLGKGQSCNLGDSELAKDFEYSASQLQPGTRYYVCAYAENAEGINYSEQQVFETKVQPQVPSVETGSIADIRPKQATVSGNIVTMGNETSVSQYGHVWSTSTNPTTANNKTSLGYTSTIGTYTSILSELQPHTTYYVRAYATNSTGTAYGENVMFTTAYDDVTLATLEVSGITYNSAVTGGIISDKGGHVVRERGICWSTFNNPTTSDDKLSSQETTDRYSIRISGLNEQTVYHVRAYVLTADGETYYGNDVTFETAYENKVPLVETDAIMSVQAREATASGNILRIGDETGITQHGHVWNTTSNPTLLDHKTTLGSATVVGAYTSKLTDLLPHTTYHIRAYATNSVGTAYGEDVSFTTAYDVVSLTTIAVSDVIHDKATTGGSISDKGGHSIAERGVCWSKSPYPTISDDHMYSTAYTDRFLLTITGLSELTDYYVRAYVQTEDGETFYGNNVGFKTTHEIKLPQSAKVAVSSIGTGSATFRSSIVSDGDGTIVDCGFVYSKSPEPIVNNATRISCGGVQTGYFSKTVTGLSDNTTYYVRAYVINEAGISYGEETDFATLEIVPPSVTNVSVGRVTYKSVSLSASVISAGNGSVSDAGFVYSTSSNPVMSNHKVSCGKTSDLSVKISTLLPETTYYVRAYATNEKGTTLGEQVTFTTAAEPAGNDVDFDDYGEDKDWN